MKGDNDGFTYIGNLGSSTIDYVIANNKSWHMVESIGINTMVDSDHLPISISLKEKWNTTIKPSEYRDTEEVSFALKRYNWERKYEVNFMHKAAYLMRFIQGLINLICNEKPLNIDSFIKYMQQLFELAGTRMCRTLDQRVSRKLIPKGLIYKKKKAKRKLRLFRKTRTLDALYNYQMAKNKWVNSKKEYWKKKQDLEKMKYEAAIKAKDVKTLWYMLRLHKRNTQDASRISSGVWMHHFNNVFNVVLGPDREEWRTPDI